MNDKPKSDLRLLIEALRSEADQYFRQATEATKEDEGSHWFTKRDPDHYWSQTPEEDRALARALAGRLVRYTAELALKVRSAPLVGTEDLVDLRQATKAMRAALRFRKYRFHDTEILNDEDRVLGVRQASQSDDEPLAPLEASAVFHDHTSRILQILTLTEASADLAPSPADPQDGAAATRYRTGTAFIMMWMDPARPELADTVDTVKATFRKFGISAVRADDIEHEGQITQRVLNELRTSEFLFADLTGARPNVYYEVGFAHALGRRVVLYRQSGTGLHFDLAGYNCPEYTNMRDLREKLTKRLEIITNRSPGLGEGDA